MLINVVLIRRDGLTHSFQSSTWREAFEAARNAWVRASDVGRPEYVFHHMFFSDGNILHHADVVHDLRAVARLRERLEDGQ